MGCLASGLPSGGSFPLTSLWVLTMPSSSCFSKPGEEQHCCQPQATVPSQVGFSAHTFVDGALIKLFSYSVGNAVFMQKPDQ